MPTEGISTHYKARQINLEGIRHGVFAEIGAGQEVVRWFFRVGGASATVAKTISAYDMAISDAIYGPTPHYVSRNRLQAMLDHEYGLLLERLNAQRGKETSFFVFADTVATRSSLRHQQEGHGWMGIRFQHQPQAPASDIVIHVRMLDTEYVREQEAIGILGVNLLYGAFYLYLNPNDLISSLLNELSTGRVEVDMIRFSGPAFPGIDNRLMSLQLVEQGLTNATMFAPDGETVQLAEVLYQKSVLIERGSFRPVTNTTLDMLERASEQFLEEFGGINAPPNIVMEMTLHNLLAENRIDHADFLARADILGALGKLVMITNFSHHYSVASFLRRYTSLPIVFALGVPNLRELIDERFYKDLPGGILEFMGGLFQKNVKVYLYPTLEADTGKVTTAQTLQVPPNLAHLYSFLIENNFVVDIKNYDPQLLHIFAGDLLTMIQEGNPAWETMVPAACAQLIKEHHYFGHKAVSAAASHKTRIDV
jgi:hypothetical protein